MKNKKKNKTEGKESYREDKNCIAQRRCFNEKEEFVVYVKSVGRILI